MLIFKHDFTLLHINIIHILKSLCLFKRDRHFLFQSSYSEGEYLILDKSSLYIVSDIRQILPVHSKFQPEIYRPLYIDSMMEYDPIYIITTKRYNYSHIFLVMVILWVGMARCAHVAARLLLL